MKTLYKDLKNKTIIITGGLGFLASQFTKAFEENSSKVIILDNRKTNRKNFYKCDLTKEKEIKAVASKIKKKYK